MSDDNPINRFGDKVSHGRNLNTFSSSNQPQGNGKKKVAPILKLMKAMGNNLAPKDLREDETVKEFLDVNSLKGTVHEVMLARLYTLALYKGDIKAIKLILDMLHGKYTGSKHGGIIIQFVAPAIAEGNQEREQELQSDSWTVVTPGEAKSD